MKPSLAIQVDVSLQHTLVTQGLDVTIPAPHMRWKEIYPEIKGMVARMDLPLPTKDERQA